MKALALIASLVITSAIAAADTKAPPPKTPAPAKKPGAKTPPPTPEKIRADKLFEDGRRYLASKEYAIACTAFEQSHEADPAIGTLLNIALCYEEWGKIASAYRAYLEAERYAELKFDERSKGAHKKVDELASRVPRLRVDVPADADVSTVFLFDGKELARAKLADELLLDPGPHDIEARVPGRPPRKTQLDLKLGERKRITIDVPRPEMKVIVTVSPRNKRRLFGGIGMAIGGAAAIGVASFVSLVARQDYADALAGCPNLVCESRADYDATQSARRRATIMTFVGAGGAVLVGTGLYFILTSSGKRSEKRVELVPVIDAGGIGFALGGRL